MRSEEIVGGGGGEGSGAVLPYGLDRYVPPDMLTMVSTLKQGIIFVLASIVFRVWSFDTVPQLNQLNSSSY